MVLSNVYRLQNDLTVIDAEVKNKLSEIKDQLDALKGNEEIDKKQRKALIDVCKKDIKYLSRCENELGKMIKSKTAQG